MSRLTGKVALITGAGGPNTMGGAIALELAREGADVAISNIEAGREATGALAEIIKAEGVRCLVCLGDIRRVPDCQRLVAETLEFFQQLDILVNCAGVGIVQNVLDVTEQDYDQIMDVNLKGTFFLSQAAIRHMSKRGSGRIINIGSELAYKGDPLACHYAASKAGIRGLSKSLALAVGPGVTVNTVAPGPTNTDTFKTLAECNEENREKLPLKRFVNPAEVGRTVVFLASCDGDCYTGQTLDPNAGAVLD